MKKVREAVIAEAKMYQTRWASKKRINKIRIFNYTNARSIHLQKNIFNIYLYEKDKTELLTKQLFQRFF